MMKIPTIHLNGSSGERLRDDYYRAYCAVDAAFTEVAEAAPNARDYYPQGDGAWRAAETEHRQRLAALRAVRNELQMIHFEICRELDEQEARRNAR